MAIRQYVEANNNSVKRDVTVSGQTLEKLSRCSSGSLTTQLFKGGYRQPAFVGLKAMIRTAKPFTGRAFTMRFIPAHEEL